MSNGGSTPDPVQAREALALRIHRLTSELQRWAGTHAEIDAVTMRLLLNDSAALIAQLRATAREAEARIIDSAATLKAARRWVRHKEKLRLKRSARPADGSVG